MSRFGPVSDIDTAPHPRLNGLELHLGKLHCGQGLVLGGTVIDKPKLKRLFGAIASGITTLYTLLLGLAADSHPTPTPPGPASMLGMYTVSAVQQAAIRAVMLGDTNATACDYNTTQR